MLRCSMVRCPEEGEEGEGETAFIDQRAVAAGKNPLRESGPQSVKLTLLLLLAPIISPHHRSMGFASLAAAGRFLFDRPIHFLKLS